jgi:tetratricopeptide (TPR) repeat protein
MTFSYCQYFEERLDLIPIQPKSDEDVLEERTIAMENNPDRDIRPEDINRDRLADSIYTCAENGDILGAIDCLDLEIKIEPDSAYLYAERANFRQRIGDIPGAIADYDLAISLQPHNQLFKQWRNLLG